MLGWWGPVGPVNFTNQMHQPVMYNPQYSTRSFSLLTFHLIGGDRGGPNPFPWRRNVGVVGTSGASEFHESNAPTFNLHVGNYDQFL